MAWIPKGDLWKHVDEDSEEYLELEPPSYAVWTRPIRSPRPPDVDPYPTEARLAELRAMPYAEYLKSPEWLSKRWHVVKLAQRRCERCGSTASLLDVHHRTYERLGWEFYEDLEVLCRPCHKREHGIAA